MKQGSLYGLLVVEDSSLEGAPPHVVDLNRWGISVSRSGEVHMSVITAAVDDATALEVRAIELDATAAVPEDFKYRPGWFPILAGAGTSGVIAVDCDTQPGTVVLFDAHSEMPETADDRIAADVAELVDRYITLLDSDMVTGPEPHWPHRVQIELFADDPWVYNLL
jgi:hypothetical protein